MYKFQNQITAIEKYCDKNFENVEDNIFKIIDEDMDDHLKLIKVYDGHCTCCNSLLYILLDEELFHNFQNVKDYIYTIEEVKDTLKKDNFIKHKIQYVKKDENRVNNFLIKMSMVLLHDQNDQFINYLKNHIKQHDIIFDYHKIIQKGWLKPKFNCVNIFLNAFI